MGYCEARSLRYKRQEWAEKVDGCYLATGIVELHSFVLEYPDFEPPQHKTEIKDGVASVPLMLRIDLTVGRAISLESGALNALFTKYSSLWRKASATIDSFCARLDKFLVGFLDGMKREFGARQMLEPVANPKLSPQL